ncbi:unnamed protein product, partial [marine sediment metagenome]
WILLKNSSAAKIEESNNGEVFSDGRTRNKAKTSHQ